MPLLQKQDLEHRQRQIASRPITNMQTRYAHQVLKPASIIAQVAENQSLDALLVIRGSPRYPPGPKEKTRAIRL